MLNFCSISVISNWSSECMCHQFIVSIVQARLWHMVESEEEDLRVKGALWQGFVNVQCRKPPEVVTATAEVLDELGLKEKATELRG